MKELWIDVETTGLSPEKNFVHQIAGLIVIDNDIKEQFDLRVRPPRGTILNKVALEIGNVTKEDLEGYPPHDQVYHDLIKMFSKFVDKYDKEDKFTFHGYNCHFDVGFMRTFFLANSDNYYGSWIWSNNVDVMVLASQHLRSERHKMKNFKLHTVMEYLKIQQQGVGAHDGMTDILGTRDIYLKLLNNV